MPRYHLQKISTSDYWEQYSKREITLNRAKNKNPNGKVLELVS